MKWIGLAACLLAAGCAQQKRAEAQAQAEVQWKRVESSCNTQYPAQVGNYVARTRCAAPALREYYAARGLPADLSELLAARRAVIAGQMDRQEITPEEGQLRYAEARSNINDRMLRRLNDAAASSPPPYIPQAPMVIQQAPAQVYAPPRQTSCTRFGNTVNCSSY